MASLKTEISPVASFYEGKIILLTGGTGFMGKVMIEKLLMCCPGIKKIYVLIRSKKGEDINLRLAKIKDGMAFQSLKSEHPKQLDKLQALEGDLVQPELGISEADRKLLLDVNVVFNMAATVNFNEDLRTSLKINVLATKALLDICLDMKHLNAFVHTSTAYSNCNCELIEEKVYPAPVDLDQLVKECQNCSDEDVHDLTARVLGNRPNTYILTKALAENVVQSYSDRIPIAMIRPSVVTPSLRTPLPGWVDCKSGSTGLLTVVGNGTLRLLYGNNRITIDIVPVDVTDNLHIVVAWKTARLGVSEPIVYNAVSGAANKITLGDMINYFIVHSRDFPQDTVLWYPDTFFTQNRLLYKIGRFFLQAAPAYVHDYLLSTEKLSLVRVHRSVQKAVTVVEYFMQKGFEFAYDNVPSLLNEMDQHDRSVFNFDIRQINWFDYIRLYVQGVRKYLLNQKDENLPKAKHSMFMYSVKDTVLKICAAVAAYYLTVTWLTPIVVGVKH